MMTVGVVDRLGVIEIERDKPPCPGALAAKPRERRVERRTVREPRQFVVRCAIFALGGQCIALERERAKVETGMSDGNPPRIGEIGRAAWGGSEWEYVVISGVGGT